MGIVALSDIEPGLGRFVGMHAAGRIGHLPLLPEIDVPQGPWRPSRPTGALALAVVSGLLQTPQTLLGPGDRFAPWAVTETWTACTDVRLAVLGHELIERLRPWPELAAQLADHRIPTVPLPSDDGDAELLNFLWRIAQRWGTIARDGISLPAGLDERVLRSLSPAPEAVADALARMVEASLLITPPGAQWQLLGRDDMRARVAYGLACARATGETFAMVDSTSGPPSPSAQ